MKYDTEDINLDILKTAAGILMKRALELHSLEDDSKLREILKPIAGIETRIHFFYIIKWPSRYLDTLI